MIHKIPFKIVTKFQFISLLWLPHTILIPSFETPELEIGLISLKYVNDVTYYQSCVTLIMAGSLTLHDDKKSIGKNHDFISYNIFSFCLPGTSLLSAAP